MLRGERSFPARVRKISPALRKQGRANFSGRSEASSLPPQHLEFVSERDGFQINQLQTFSIILPNLVHKSRKRNLKN